MTKVDREPRRVGDRCLCGYWRKEYTVLAITTIAGKRGNYLDRITVEWDDGTVGTHMTSWDAKHGDRILSRQA